MRLTVDTPRTTGLRALLGEGLGWRKPKTEQITTAPGQLGAGETETEADEPPRHLPTTRIRPASEPLVPPNTLTTILFEASRLLSVVPALLGASINAWCLWSPPGYTTTALPDRGDYFLAVLWLTTGLLHRWRAYYPPLSTLIRLLALQAICWPATHFTLDSTLLRWTTVRPDVCWAVIGTTTCFSRSIQIWVTSNLLPSSRSRIGISVMPSAIPDRLKPKPKKGNMGDETRKLTGRRWDWGVVARVCMFPAGCLYFVMAWIGAWRREVGGS
ncbi:hypothetical protein HYDPIDRAFT_100597 [Hydnomerulius pinastri MD-312]|uniref:Uncharacterized protein n=1 Tax=Hydnomerulius pinastri MD-312 TaxID=994086 RepID=A0A0C9W8R7_9AGAM|nr:hypothetical protein HYDPIDRAFT_100597 [Hydnomerulius pinastri MD-312]